MGHRSGRTGVWLAGLGAAAVAVIAAAAFGQPPSADPIGDLIGRSDTGGEARPGDFERDYLAPLFRRSCPAGVQRLEPDAIQLKATPVPLQGVNPFRKNIGQLTFVAGFHLTSADKRFGGLSGLDVRSDGGLLAVSDDGAFVWIDLAADGVTPIGARMAAMLDDKGEAFASKSAGDAEGLALNGDVALVSFEGEHRVLAYDIGKCGAAARGAPIASSESLPEAFARQDLKVGGNLGAEGLAVSPDWKLFAGLETRTGNASPLTARAIGAAPEFDIAIGAGAPELVGLDILPAGEGGRDVRLFSLHRSTNPLASSAITIVETYLEATLDQANLPARVISEIDERARQRYRVASSRVLAEMNVFVTIDNFEGLAVSPLPDGGARLFVVSDDNFSARQRTLLMVYDLDGAP
jgi:hypothetical protein